MKISATKMKAGFSSYLEQCAQGPVIVTKNGRPTAVLLSVSNEEELERLVLAHTPRFIALLDRAGKRIRRTGGVRHKEFWTAIRKKRRGKNIRA